jgi:hypothetical protein
MCSDRSVLAGLRNRQQPKIRPQDSGCADCARTSLLASMPAKAADAQENSVGFLYADLITSTQVRKRTNVKAKPTAAPLRLSAPKLTHAHVAGIMSNKGAPNHVSAMMGKACSHPGVPIGKGGDQGSRKDSTVPVTSPKIDNRHFMLIMRGDHIPGDGRINACNTNGCSALSPDSVVVSHKPQCGGQ